MLIRYSTTPSIPLLVADAAAARAWNGGALVGAIRLAYWCDEEEGEETFATLAEAKTREAELIARYRKRYPKARRPPGYPDYPAWSIGGERVFVVERFETTALDTLLKKVKKTSVVALRAQPKVSALAFDAEDSSGGLIVVNDDTIVIAAIITADDDDGPLGEALEKIDPRRLRAAGRLSLGPEVLIFGAAEDGTRLAAVAQRALKKAASAPLRVPKQAIAGGACARVSPGVYRYAVARDRRAGKMTYDALVVWREPRGR
jgi:hypothetical protein